MAVDMTPAPVRRGKRSREESGRGALVAHAVQLMSAEGIHGMSIGALARRSGYTKGGVMAHFETKEELVVSALEEAVTMARGFFREELRDAATPGDRLARTLDAYGKYWMSGLFEGGCPFVNLAVHAVDGESAVGRALHGAARTFVEDFAGVVRLGQATGAFHAGADAQAAGARIMALCVGCGWFYRMTGDGSIFARTQPALMGVLAELHASVPEKVR
ncbi:MAG: TetR/AcrR family transcriptional regulator [Gemmatimonadota bacterium]|jgi:AcrR family transcriptional regulator|nr:TetR/AcrR family transcriptional regulator [Gemmatimonadota bacterium]MDP6801664.1 TetR/AcrR family transcriptional regulator [Gemmatimonadota bacterium]